MSAHAELFNRFAAPVFTLACRLVKRRDVAEEVLQETFLDVMRRIASYRGEAPFGFWLRRIAVNRCLMVLRSYWEQHAEVLDDELPDLAGDLNRALLNADLESLLERLPAVSRTVLWLHDVEGYTHQEIAALLGKSTSFSKSQLARSHVRLRAMVTDDAARDEVSVCMPISNS